VTVSKALNRHSEETLGLNIQIEESIFEKSRQPRAYRGLAEAADASEEDAHVAVMRPTSASSFSRHRIRHQGSRRNW
jgi:hypothetical protein